MLSAEGLAAIRQRLEEATPGPWHACTCGKCGLVWPPGDGDSIICDAHGWRDDDHGLPANPNMVADHTLIAAAPSDIAALLATVEELRGLLDEARLTPR